MLDEWTQYDWFSVHNHSKFSVRDALGSPEQIIARADQLGWPAIGLTDHGTVAGVAQLYTAARRHDIMPIPGMEAYYVHDRGDRKAKRMHVTLLATTTQGWRNLVGINNYAHRNSYKGYPLLDFSDLAKWSEEKTPLEGITLGTGCMNGPVPRGVFSQVPTTAANTLLALLQLFRGRVFVEVMQHNISIDSHDDDLLNTLLVALADEFSIPVIGTADCHYVNKADKPHHDFYKQISNPHVGSEGFNGDGYYLYSSGTARQRFGDDLFFRTLGGLRWLTEDYSLSIPELDDFTIKVPSITRQNPDEVLRDKVGIDHDTTLAPKAKKRLDQELEVIGNAGFAPYMLLVAKLCDWMREQGILYSARGSASGSLVCYRLGITSVNPLFFKLRFDRFLSGDRLKPPDIDLDVDGERRSDVITWLGDNFSMMPIGAWSKLSMTDDEHGSLLVKWKTWARLNNRKDDKPTPVELRQLKQLSAQEPLGATTMHAAGVVVVDDDATLNKLPIQHITSSGTEVTAFDGNDIDNLGYLKIDVLSVSMLTAVSKALTWVGITLDEIPWRDDKTMRRIAKGHTHSLFQLGGWSQRNGIQKLKPTTFNDLVAAMALFRPAVTASESGQRQLKTFIQRRHRKTTAAVVDALHPVLHDAVKETYGVFLYQEQVMQVLRALGMSAEELTDVLKAIKSSNANTGKARKTMNKVTKQVEQLLVTNDVPEEQHALFLEALLGYAEYGFNKSHAVAYARWAFVTGWLATHHPQAWWAAELSTCKPEVQKTAIKAAKDDGVLIRPAHVNYSQLDWTPEGKSYIRKGLMSVPEIGEATATKIVEQAPFNDLSDLTERVKISGAKHWLQGRDETHLIGNVKMLVETGALNGLEIQ